MPRRARPQQAKYARSYEALAVSHRRFHGEQRETQHGPTSKGRLWARLAICFWINVEEGWHIHTDGRSHSLLTIVRPSAGRGQPDGFSVSDDVRAAASPTGFPHRILHIGFYASGSTHRVLRYTERLCIRSNLKPLTSNLEPVALSVVRVPVCAAPCVIVLFFAWGQARWGQAFCSCMPKCTRVVTADPHGLV